jgi:hypothetical protein
LSFERENLGGEVMKKGVRQREGRQPLSKILPPSFAKEPVLSLPKERETKGDGFPPSY